ncbi:ferritin heavy chain-like [Meriones unguiculatus]|uniref:ferritin heavy chain-like n=1 Tax=Meriones unguiculatus TaxID=10047 RepID=UPI00293F1AFD|nr:ferritin heavy chain-like [Meriones unguiculatus]
MGLLRGSDSHQHYRCPLRFSRARAGYLLLFVPLLMVSPLSQVRQNYHRDCEATVNSHIQLQLQTSFLYLSMAFCCDHEDVGLKNSTSFFLNKSQECTANAEMSLTLRNRRGGISLRTVSKPDCNDWIGSFPTIECASQLELALNQSLAALHKLAISNSDAHLSGFLQNHFLQKQVEVLKEISSYLTSMHQMGSLNNAMAEDLLDKLTLANANKEN